MIRFLHTADWQIGMKAAGLGAASQRVREARLDSIRRIIAIAKDRSIEVILVAGDVFEDNAVDRLLVRKVGEALSGYPGKTFIIPGNHDPLVPGSVWEHPVWNDLPNVTVVREPAPIALEGCTLYPCPLKAKYSPRNPTSWIDAHASEPIAIGLAHGTVEGLPGMEPDYPIPRDAASRTGLDYLAIGHWHSYSAFPDSNGQSRMAYSGTHETTKFGERDSGNLLIVEVEARGALPKIQSVPTGQLNWHSADLTLDRDHAIEQAFEILAKVENPSESLVRLRLSGLLRAADRDRLAELEEILQARFLFGS